MNTIATCNGIDKAIKKSFKEWVKLAESRTFCTAYYLISGNVWYVNTLSGKKTSCDFNSYAEFMSAFQNCELSPTIKIVA